MKKILATILFISLVISANAQTWNQIIKTTSSDRGDGEQFGFSVAISGEYAIVSAYRDDEDEIGANPKLDAGSVFIFKRNGTGWSLQQKLVSSDRNAEDFFGYSVDIDGDYAVVGAFQEDEDVSGSNTLSNAGAIYVFKNANGNWSQVQKLVASDRAVEDNFGFSVGISGNYIIASAYREDEDTTGSNTLSASGSAYIFKNNAGVWSQQQKIIAKVRSVGDNFGWNVAIDADQIVVGAYSDRDDVNEANPLLNAGSAYIFKDSLGTWVQKQKIVNSDRATFDRFGHSVCVEGDYVIIGANLEDEDATGGNTMSASGSVYIFKFNAGTWSQIQKIVASDRGVLDNFGNSVSVAGDYLAVGTHREDEDANGNNTMADAGAVYVYKNNAGTWTQIQKLVTADRAVGDFFGFDVAISGNHLLAGSHLDDEDTAGNNFLMSAGSAYFFGLDIAEIAVYGNNYLIADGDLSANLIDHTDFGSMLSCVGSISRTFVIKNIGWDTLFIDSIKLSGSASADYSITMFPDTIMSGMCDTLKISFNPSANGIRNASISIYNNDLNESIYDFAIKGEGLSDTQPPVVNCPANKTVTTLAGFCTISGVSLGSASATDNCGIFGGISNNAPSTYMLGVSNVIWTATDVNGNTGSCIQKITVLPYSCGTPFQVYHTDTTNSSAKIKWKAGKCASAYELRIRQQISPGIWGVWSSWTIASGPGLVHSFTGLVPNKFYNYQIRSICGVSNSPSVNNWFNTLPSLILISDRSGEYEDSTNDTKNNIVVQSIDLIPNPANDFLRMNFSGFENSYKEVVCLNSFGGIVFQIKLDPQINALDLDLNVLSMNTGLYFIRVDNGHKQITKKLIIQH